MIRLFSAALLALGLSLPLSAQAEIDIQEVTSEGGINAWLVNDPSIPFVALQLNFRGGASLDAPGKRGAVYLMTGLLEEGAADLDAQAYARALEAAAASISYDSSDDEISVSAQFLSENRDEALDLLRIALSEPRFDPDAVERVRAQVISGLRSDAQDPNDIAGATFGALAFGDHPYGSVEKGSIESVSALTREDLIAAHQASMTRDRIFVGAVGDITAQALGPLLDQLLAGLPETGAPLPGPAEVTLPGGIEVVDFDTPQSVAIFGHEGIARDDDDFFAAYILNHILGGGGFESRLMTEVREKRGLTYGVYSYLVPKDLAALYMGSVASANDRIAEAVSVIRDEWQRAAQEGFTAEELAEAKTYLTGAYPLRFDGNARIASILVGMQMQDLPIDYIATRNDQVNAVTLEELNRVAGELLRPEALQFVIVGQPDGLTDPASE